METLIGVLTALTGLLSAIGAKQVWEYLGKRQERKRSQGTKDALQTGFLICAALHKMRTDLGGHRAMIIMAHNGGGEVSARKPTYTSILHQVHDEHLPQEQWREEPVDDGYWTVLQEICQAGQHKYVNLRSDALMKGSQLRNLYEANGIAESIVFELFSTPEAYYYVSVNRKAEDGVEFASLPEASVAETVRVKRHKLTQLLSD